MRSAVTVSLVPESRGGPFVYWNGLADAFAQASALGFDAVEIFPPSAEAIDVGQVQELCSRYRLKVAAVGTGGGWVIHKWHLCHADSGIRQQAQEFVIRIIDTASKLDAPAIIGSMQGRVEGEVHREQALAWLAEALARLAKAAESRGQHLLYEPLNRYETNVFNRIGDATDFLRASALRNVKILADMFHMNLEEASLPEAIRVGGDLIGHVHFADSNRRAIGLGHTDVAPVMSALREIGYAGYLSAEILPLPDSTAAARRTIESYRRLAVSA